MKLTKNVPGSVGNSNILTDNHANSSKGYFR